MCKHLDGILPKLIGKCISEEILLGLILGRLLYVKLFYMKYILLRECKIKKWV